MKKLISLMLSVSLAGCATLGRNDPSLKVKVKPFPIIQGKPFSAEINAPADAVEVVGHALVPTNPEMRFKWSKSRRQWRFTGTIPDVFYIHPGKFKVRVTVQMPGEKNTRATEIQMVLIEN
jgi:hypothetical protein